MGESTYRCAYCTDKNSEAKYPVNDIFGDEYFLHQCKTCAAWFLAPPPTQDQLNRAYDSSYYGEQEEKFKAPIVEKVLDLFRMGRAKRLAKRLKDGDKVLDVGCGNGRFLLYLLKFGHYKLYGTELEGNSAKRAERISEINLKVGMLKPGDFENSTFDAITMFQVFEHLTEPREMLEIITNIIKPGGITVLSFPNIASKQSKWFKGLWLHLDPPRHLFYFAPRDFKNLMKDFNFELLSEHYLSSEQNPFGMVQSILNKWTDKREVLFESMKGNKEYIKEYSGINLAFQKLFFLCSFPLFIITDVFASWTRKGATVEFTFRKN